MTVVIISCVFLDVYTANSKFKLVYFCILCYVLYIASLVNVFKFWFDNNAHYICTFKFLFVGSI